MKQYLFYTPEGYTESSTGIKTENFQILGFVFAEDVEKARSLLLDENPWIEEAGYSLEEIVGPYRLICCFHFLLMSCENVIFGSGKVSGAIKTKDFIPIPFCQS